MTRCGELSCDECSADLDICWRTRTQAQRRNQLPLPPHPLANRPRGRSLQSSELACSAVDTLPRYREGRARLGVER